MNDDFLDLLCALQEAGAEFVVIGAHALAANGIVRATVGLDVLVRPTPANAQAVYAGLRAFGAPLATHGVTVADLSRTGTVYQMGLPPRRIDITTAIEGVTYEQASAKPVIREVGGMQVPFLRLAEVLRSKRAAGRAKDLADLELVREAGFDVEALLAAD